MKLAFGLKAHSGWAALVILGKQGASLQVVDRQRMELVAENALWAKQPFHAAEGLSLSDARKVVRSGIDAARRIALREMRRAIKRACQDCDELQACALIVGDPMPDWSVEEILAVHFRMHKAEGVLFRDVLARAAQACDVSLVEVPEKQLLEQAQAALKIPASTLLKRIATLGKSAGPPWGKDQKDATIAAMIALQGA
jgi:hypothetical protein